MKIQKRLGEDRIVDSLKRFFSNKKILKLKKLGKDRIMDFLKHFFQIRNFKNSKHAGRRLPYFYQTNIESK